MLISEICIKRPVFATVLSLIILLVGATSFFKLSIRGVPDVDPPLIVVTSQYNGSSAEYMEKNITNLIEKSMRSIKNVDFISSSSSVGTSRVIIFFKLNADLDQALSDIRSKISEISFSFPSDMQLPQAAKQDADGFPSLWLIISSNQHDPLSLTDIIEKQVLIQLERIDSVGMGLVRGGKYYTVKINLDPIKLYQYKMTPLEIEGAIKSQNIDYPAGDIKSDKINFTINLDSRIKDPEEFKNIILKTIDKRIIKLRDVADVAFEAAEEDSILRFNGQKAIAIGLIKQSKANILDLSKDLRKALPKIEQSLPQGVKISIAYDQAKPVSASIYSVGHAVLESLVLVFLVVYLFLGSGRITIIPFVTIPISLIGTFAFMHFCGFSINTFSLLAMVLAIGLVVDDAIVVLENTYRYTEQGLDKFQAATKSIKEIGFAIVAMTTTLAAVFLPIGFLEGFIGKLFIEFAWTLAFCVILSGFVAITLTPMMCSKLIEAQGEKSMPWIILRFGEAVNYLEQKYVKLLDLSFRHRKIFIAICLSTIKLLVVCFYFVGKTFAPQEDDGVLQMLFSMPEGSSLSQAEKASNIMQNTILAHKEVENLISITSGGGGFGFIMLKDWAQRSKSQQEIRAQLNRELSEVPEGSAFVVNLPSAISGPAQKPVEFNLQGLNCSLDELDAAADKFIAQMRTHKDFSNIEKSLKSSTPGIDITIEKDKAQGYGLSTATIGTTLRYLIAGKNISDFLMNDLIYNVVMRLAPNNRSHITDLTKIYVKSEHGNMIPLSVATKTQENSKIQTFQHYNNVKSISISADLGDNASLGAQGQVIKEIAKNNLDANKVKMEFLGNLKRMQEQSSALLFIFALSLLFIYLVLSAQFESFKDPLIILFSVPCSIIGALIALLLFGNSINLYSNIGIITLIGLVTKNAIMIVEFAGQLKESGQSVSASIMQAAQIRFRPILMTSMSTALGALPLVLATGGGAAARVSIGLVIVGGMLTGTVFTLFVIPFLYKLTHKDA
jgi:HAE1 family hydrophobic/amphiphilic exporter-1